MSAYELARERLRAAILRTVPPGCTVAVVSKGDEELVQIEGRDGWHFPRTERGAYAAHNPADGPAAVAHLEALRLAGAQFLVLPSVYFWWLDHYPELREHLERRCRRIAADADSGAIYALADVDALPTAAAIGGGEPAGNPLLPGIRMLVAALLPEGETALVLSAGDDELLAIGRPALALAAAGGADRSLPGPRLDGAAVRELATVRERGIRFLIVPRTSFELIEPSTALGRHLRRRWRLVAMRARICAIFELA